VPMLCNACHRIPACDELLQLKIYQLTRFFQMAYLSRLE
jgi:hypothetical protein